MVQLRGLIRNGTANTSMFTLPVGYRPPNGQLFTCIANVQATWNTGAASAGTAHTHAATGPPQVGSRVDILPAGTVAAASAGTGFIDLGGIQFSVTP
jgi:hypothetical protein